MKKSLRAGAKATGKSADQQVKAEHPNTVPIRHCSISGRDAYFEMRQRKLGRPIRYQGHGFLFEERSDSQLLDFVSRVITSNESNLRCIIDSGQSDEGGEAVNMNKLALGATLIAARAADKRARWNGLRNTPSIEDEAAGRSREPMLLDLFGLAGQVPVTDSDLLFQICDSIYSFKKEIKAFGSEMIGNPARELAELLLVAEQVVDRGGAATECELADRQGRRTSASERLLNCKMAEAFRS